MEIKIKKLYDDAIIPTRGSYYEGLMRGESLETQMSLIKRYDAYNNKRK